MIYFKHIKNSLSKKLNENKGGDKSTNIKKKKKNQRKSYKKIRKNKRKGKKEKMKNFKGKFLKTSKGITLVAMVVTIIVLLILAGVAIATLMGDNGVINQTSQSKTKNRIAGAQEEVELAIQALRIDKISKNVGGTLAAYILETDNQAEFKKAIGSDDVTFEDGYITYKNIKFAIDSNGIIIGKTEVTNGGEQPGGNDVEYAGLTPEEVALLSTNNMEELEVDDIEANVDAISTLSADEKATRKAALEDTEKIKTVLTGNTPIPVGYTYYMGTSTDANAVGTNGWGVVVKDSNQNEFVWVPVPYAKVLYDEIEGTGTEVGKTEEIKVASLGDMPAIQLASTGVNATKKSKSIIVERGDINSDGYREPALVTDFDLDGYDDDKSQYYYQDAGFNSPQAMATTFVTDYNNMIESIAKYGGFYVGRYELSISDSNGNEGSNDLNHEFADGNTAHVKSGRVPADGFNWYQLYKACRSLGNSTTTSTMVWGCQWDILCTWAQNSGDQISYSTSDENRHSSNYIATAGSNNKDKRNNIYDLEGSRFEWTQEAYNTNRRVCRGGYYIDYSAGSYFFYSPDDSGSMHLGSRATLYIR